MTDLVSIHDKAILYGFVEDNKHNYKVAAWVSSDGVRFGPKATTGCSGYLQSVVVDARTKPQTVFAVCVAPLYNDAVGFYGYATTLVVSHDGFAFEPATAVPTQWDQSQLGPVAIDADGAPSVAVVASTGAKTFAVSIWKLEPDLFVR